VNAGRGDAVGEGPPHASQPGDAYAHDGAIVVSPPPIERPVVLAAFLIRRCGAFRGNFTASPAFALWFRD